MDRGRSYRRDWQAGTQGGERDADGNDIEDWIYGQPPSKTVFVRFTGNRVTSVKAIPQ